MRLILFDMNPDMCAAWRKVFGQDKDVDIINCDLTELSPCDYLITAGNSYGIMNGGIDLTVRNFYGVELQDEIQWIIVNKCKGLLKIGDLIDILLINDNMFKHLIYVPTMRIPGPVSAENVTIAFGAAIEHIFDSEIKKAYSNTNFSIACPGLCTGAGGVNVLEAASRMRVVWNYEWDGNFKMPPPRPQRERR